VANLIVYKIPYLTKTHWLVYSSGSFYSSWHNTKSDTPPSIRLANYPNCWYGALERRKNPLLRKM